jgi:hypothetical protein
MSTEERELADLLKRVVPEPPRQLTYEEITVLNVERTVKSWLVPTLAAASILIIGGAVGAVAATSSGRAAPAAPAAYQGDSPAPSPSARPTSPGCQPSPEPTPTAAHGGSVVVPSVVGRQQDAAMLAIDQIGLRLLVHQTASKTVPAGLVVAEAPAPGSRLSQGATVTLTVSAGSTGAKPAASPRPTASAAPVASPTCLTPAPIASPTGGPSPAPTGAPVAMPTPWPTAPSAVRTATPTAPATAVPTTAPTAPAARG